MIGWIVEKDRRQAVLLHERRVIFELLHQDCSIYKDNGIYHIKLPYGFIYLERPQIEHEAITRIKDVLTASQAAVYWSMYDSGYGTFRHYSWGSGTVTLGSAIDDDIYVQDRNLKPRQFLIDLRKQTVTDLNRSGMADLSGRTVTETPFCFGERFRVLNVQMILSDSFLAVSSTANTYCRLEEQRLPEEQLPTLPQTRFLCRPYQIPAEPFCYETELCDPLPAERSRKRPLVFVMGPALMMSSASLTAGLLSAYNGWLNGRSPGELAPIILLPSVMVISALLWNPLQRIYDNRKERAELRRRTDEYQNYLQSLKDTILDREACYIDFLEKRFTQSVPPENQMWRSLPEQTDHLCVRIGTGPVHCDVKLNQNFRCQVNDPIPEMIDRVMQETVIRTMPVLLDLKKYHFISISYDPEYRDYLIGLFFQLLFYHGPDVLQVVFLIPQNVISSNQWIRELPHVRNRNGFRNIAATVSEAAEIAGLLSERNDTSVLIVCMKLTLLSVFQNGNHTVIYPCGTDPVPARTDLHLILGEQGQIHAPGCEQTVRCDNMFNLSVHDCLRLFRHTRISGDQTDRFTSSAFLDLYGGSDLRCLNISGRWETADTRDHMTAYIGNGDDGETVLLDLNEKGSGPHGLIAGMTGSGKSELIITLLLSLCVNYSPREFQFVMVDFKGGGAAVLFSNKHSRVRHCAGVLSNLDESDTERALVSFQNECLRREQLFSAMSRISGKPIMNLKTYQSMWSESSSLPYLSSLLIIVDEFAELKKEQPEVMKDLISVARVGRSLGIHMILATQKPGGVVDEQIWSNMRFRICLKVQDTSDSNEMIHIPDAAFIRHPGEGYLLCDGITAHLRCGYANAPMKGRSRQVQLYDAMKHIVKEEAFQEETGVTQAEQIISEITLEQERYPEAHQLWCEPLTSVTRKDLPNQSAVWIGILDDYRNRRQSPYELESGISAVFSVDRTEKQAFLHTALCGILETSEAEDEVFLIDDLGAFEGADLSCGTICAVLRSDDRERIGNLFRHLEERDNGSAGICSLLVSDTSVFYEATEENRLRLRSLITSAEYRRIRMILCFSSASSVSYRDLSLIRERIALKNDSIQDLSSIFEQPVRYRISKPGHAMCACPELTDLCLIRTTPEELEQRAAENAKRFGTEKQYVIPAMPKRIRAADYHGEHLPLGIDIFSYAWVEMKHTQKLFILATYEEELYLFYEVMKQQPVKCHFLTDESEMRNLLSMDAGWIFLTMDRFLACGLKMSSIPVLYIGTGFKDQYRFTSGYKQELKENQGILFQTGRNTVLQLVEEIGI